MLKHPLTLMSGGTSVMKHIYSIYKITNKVNDKIYIGFTQQKPQARLKAHIRQALHPTTVKYMLHNSIVKHGSENFIVDILYQSYDKYNTLSIMEPHFIKEYNTYLGEGYNMTLGGDITPDNNGRKHSAESIQKMKDNHWLNNGMVISEKTKKLMSKSHKNIPLSEEHKKALKVPKTGRKKGWHHSQEVKDKMTKTRTGLLHTDQAKENMKAAWVKRRLAGKDNRKVKVASV